LAPQFSATAHAGVVNGLSVIVGANIRRAIRDKRLKAFRIGRDWRISVSVLAKLRGEDVLQRD
jgi:hypothetical protein